MNTLSFTKQTDGTYQAVAVVNAPFNIHVERTGDSVIAIAVSTVAGAEPYTAFRKFVPKVWEQDFVDRVYPKTITITSSERVVSGYITEEA